MKNVAITGHLGTVGGAITKAYLNLGYSVIGISRSTGYDISDPAQRSKILDLINTCDIFVNSAHVGNEQVSLLREVQALWKGQGNKLIINVSSLDVDFISKVGTYFDQKRLLHKTHWELLEHSLGPVMCLAKAGKGPTEETFDYWATELVKQLETANHYTFEFSILKKYLDT